MMRERNLALLITCINLLRSAFAAGPYCTSLSTEALTSRLCNRYYLNAEKAVPVYLYSSGMHTTDHGQCTCTLVTNGTLTSINLSNVPSSKLGEFELIVAGRKVELPKNVDYQGSKLDITFRKPKAVSVVQCIKVVPEFAAKSASTSLEIQCDTIRQIPIEQTTIVPAVIDGDGDGGGSNTGIIAVAIVGGLFVIIGAALVAIIILRRKRKGQNSNEEQREANQGAKNSYYDMTTHDGYVSADTCNAPMQHARPFVQTYEDIDDIEQGFSRNRQPRNETHNGQSEHYDYIVTDACGIPIKDDPPLLQMYEDIDEHHGGIETFAATEHDKIEWAIANKSCSAKEMGICNEESEYNVTNAKHVFPSTGNIYGVALPIQTQSITE